MRQKFVDARRDLTKTASFAALHFAVAFTVAWLLTGSVAIATGIGLLEPLANTVAFYFHERAWARAEARRTGARPAAGAYNGPPRSGSSAWPPTTRSWAFSTSAASSTRSPMR